MKKLWVFLIMAVSILTVGFGYRYFTPQPNQKVYVAVEGEGKIVAFDPSTQKIVSVIDLSIEHEGGKISYAPHNVQVSPDMRTVWVTANAGKHEGHSGLGIKSALAHGETEMGDDADQIIIISAKTDRIAKRIPIGRGIQLAHVVLTPDNAYAYVTAQKEGAIYKISAADYTIVKEIITPSTNEPHGIRVAPDNSVAYIAMYAGKTLGVLSFKTDTITEVPVNGKAVQAGVTPDGAWAFVSIYDTKRLALYRTDRHRPQTITYVDLPTEARGPVQMYPTPDSQFVYLADQGYYLGQPTSDKVYKIDLENSKVIKTITAGQAPHGVVISPDGKFVYVTNLLSGDVSIINTATDEEIGRVKVGQEPNGISFWQKK